MRTSARAIIISDSHLLVEEFNGVTFPPGGRVEDGEVELKTTLLRELKEELPNGNFTIERYLGVIHSRWGDGEGIIESDDHFY